MSNWYDALPAFENRDEMREAIAQRKDGGDAEPSAVAEAEQMPAEHGTGPDVPVVPADQMMTLIRYRKEVPGASEGEVSTARANMMRNLSVEQAQMYAAREEIAAGLRPLVRINQKGQPERA